MLPLALGLGEGGDMIAPMGTVVIGGLVSSTIFTLFVIPVFYSYIDKETRNMHKKYVTPDGEVITQKEIDANKRKEERQETPEDSEYDYHNPEDENAPKIEEFDDESSREDYLEEMQRLIDKMKNDKSDK